MVNPSDIYTFGIALVTLILAVFWLLIFIDINNERKREGIQRTKKTGKLRTVAVLIPTLAEGEELRKTVNTALASDYPKELFKIYIVLNKSSPASTRSIAYMLRSSRVKVIEAPMNGKAAVMNYALKDFIREELLLVLDADTLINRDLMYKLVMQFKSKKVGGVVSSVKVYKPRNIIEYLQSYEYMLSIMARKAMSVLGGLMVAHGAGSMFSTDIIKKVGYFDEKNYTEDIEMGLRLLVNGYLVENAIDAVSYTIVPNTLKGLVKQRLRWFSGFFVNILKYRKRIMETKHRVLGLIIVPMSLVSISLGIVVVIGLVYYFASLGLYLYTLALNTSLPYALSSSFQLSPFSLNTIYMLLIVLTAIGLSSLFYSLRSVNGSLDAFKDTIGILIYSIFYSFFLSFVWLASLIMLLIRREAVGWGTPT
ncbi:MAG: glycosyltransferase [Candidatus Acidifodinimicrobium sp.]